ncbi:MAG: PHP domain-containing protein [Gemmatimonadota bacterium]|nr:PHP domain-containing protein [Gemmatimonadota bacterium]
MKFDLHVHSHASDGRTSPVGVVRAAEAGGLDMIALTDHDTCTGVVEALAAAEGRRLRVVAGIEVSTREPEGEFHILGYFVDPRSPAVLQHQERSVIRRTERMHRMIERLEQLGVPITFQAVLAGADGEPASLGRPHLARALMVAGHVHSFGEAFERFLRDDAPAFVHTEFPSAREAIGMIHEAGGIAVWAHPPLHLFEAVVPRLAEQDLDGVECFRPTTPSFGIERLLAVTRSLGLVATGGSDWHGAHSGLLGDFRVDERQIPRMAELCAARASAERGRSTP